MNVTFHTLAAVSTAAVLSAHQIRQSSARAPRKINVLMLPIGFTAGVLLHGLLDYVPHSYPLRSGPDVAFGLILFLLAITWAKRKHRPLVGACCFGSVLPDVVDLGPAIVNRLFGWSLPVVKIFPWHWHQYSGSIYDGTKRLESLVLHLGVIMLSVGTIYFYRKSLFASGPLVDSSAK